MSCCGFLFAFWLFSARFQLSDCALDERLFKAFGLFFSLRCRNNGNYESQQDQNGKIFCVDRDGFAVTDLLEPDGGLDCEQFFYYAQEDIFIEDDVDW